ncbi:MAG: hypothetical protein LBP38_08825 [Desulfovibrio sp.]|nr:hypothetical protein [Desulfovibrio sp.]
MEHLDRKIRRKLLFDMIRIRHVEDRIDAEYLNDQMRTPVHLSIGQEAIAVGACSVARRDDVISSNHRSHGHYLAKGGDLKAMIAELHCRSTGCSKGYGGSMHLIDVSVGHYGSSSIVGGGIPIGTGYALSFALKGEDRVSLVFLGDGASEEGVFYESVSFAVLKRLPVVYILENNGLAICTPLAERQAGPSIFHTAYPRNLLPACRINGNDAEAVRTAVGKAVSRARQGAGPSFIECMTYRIPGHSGCAAQDPQGYRDPAEIALWKGKCPVRAYRRKLLSLGVVSEAELFAFEEETHAEVYDAFAFARQSPLPAPTDAQGVVYCADSAKEMKHAVYGETYYTVPEGKRREIGWIAAQREALLQALEMDPSVFLMGQGIDDPFAIFGVTKGLRDIFGVTRVFDIPLAEAALTGIAVGAAQMGMRPVYFHNRPDFLYLCLDQLGNHAAKWAYLFAGQVSVPLVVWSCIGRGWAGAGAQHSQAPQAVFTHIPGMKVVMPSTCFDAKGLLLAAIQDNNPVVFIDHRHNFKNREHVPEAPYIVPLGKGVIRRQGRDITIVATSHLVQDACSAAEELALQGIEAEVIDPRTLKPLDEELILESVKKTGRLVVADTGWRTSGFAAEVAALAAEKAFSFLKAPVQRITAPDTPAPAGHTLEEGFYVGKQDIVISVLFACEKGDAS